jgi:hypothetical protein
MFVAMLNYDKNIDDQIMDDIILSIKRRIKILLRKKVIKINILSTIDMMLEKKYKINYVISPGVNGISEKTTTNGLFKYVGDNAFTDQCLILRVK